MKSFPTIALVALLTVFFAGCIDAGSNKAVDPESLPHTHGHDGMMMDPAGLKIEAKGCEQAGGNSVYPGQMGKIGPFDAADQRPEIGDPMIGAFGAPVTGPSSGIWHVTTVCKSYTYQGKEAKNFGMGFIAQLIQKPAFDDGDQRITFMVADLSFDDATFAAALAEATGHAEISPASTNLIEWIVPQKVFHATITEENHGSFDFRAEVHKEFAKKQSEHIRFWMLPRVDGVAHDHGLASGEAAADPILYRPIAVDIYDTATGGGVKLAGESDGPFLHVQDITNPAENHPGNALGHYWNGFDRTIVIGPQPEGITFDRTWLH